MTADPIAEWVESARMRLLRQRAFRLEQLDELGAQGSDGSVDAAAREVHVALRVAAAAALADLDAALRRIERGTFGRCPQCGDSVSMSRLEAVPSAALCGPCHRGHTGWQVAFPLEQLLPRPARRDHAWRPATRRKDAEGSRG